MITEQNHLLEGTKAHLLLVQTLPAFYEWQDSAWLLEPDALFYEKTYKLVNLINEYKKAREEYMKREIKEYLI